MGKVFLETLRLFKMTEHDKQEDCEYFKARSLSGARVKVSAAGTWPVMDGAIDRLPFAEPIKVEILKKAGQIPAELKGQRWDSATELLAAQREYFNDKKLSRALAESGHEGAVTREKPEPSGGKLLTPTQYQVLSRMVSVRPVAAKPAH